MDGIDAVCFDAFGTLVEIGDKRRPFRKALLASREPDLARRVLTEPLSLEDVAAGTAPDLLRALRDDLEAEAASVALRPGIRELWEHLRRRDVRIAVCSNLALPYGEPLLRALPDVPDEVVLSYEVGMAKPEPGIYLLVCERLGLAPGRILFTGDTPDADVAGPRAAGMRALPIADFEAAWREGITPASSAPGSSAASPRG